MEKLRTLKIITIVLIVAAVLVGPVEGFSQPDYAFANPTLVSGAPLQYLRLHLTKEALKDESFRIYPMVISHKATIELNADGDGWASLELFDSSGRKVIEQQLVINKGENKIPFFGVSKMAPGNYVALLKMDGLVYTYKFIKQ